MPVTAGGWMSTAEDLERHVLWRVMLEGGPANVALRDGVTLETAERLLQALRTGRLVDQRTSRGRDDERLLKGMVKGTKKEAVSVSFRDGRYSLSVGEGSGISIVLRLVDGRVEWLESGAWVA